MFLSIIIPLYNEEATILKVIDQILKCGISEFTDQFEIVIVDDCSTDNSYNVVKEGVSSLNTSINVYHLERNKGKGNALREGLLKVNGDTVLFHDSDLELHPKDLPALIKTKIDLGVSFVNGSRYMSGIIRPIYSYKRYLANSLFSWFTSVLVDRRITDMACAYKLIDMSLLRQLNLKEDRFGIEAELVLKLLKLPEAKMAEVPVSYFPRDTNEGKKLKNSDAFKIMWAIFKYGVLNRK